jgi:uncharacterized protein (TIGR02284 family)
MQPNELVSVIGDLVVTLEDDRKGFEMASERLAEDGHPDLAEILIDLSTQRQLFSTQLKNEAADRGITIEENGSVMGTLNRGWAALADSVTGDDPHALLAAAERGEDETMSKYREVLDRTDLGELRPIIESQAFQVREAHDHVRTLRDTAR